MFKCNFCKREFDDYEPHYESHGFSDGPFEKFALCPYCHSTNFDECTEPEPYDPDLAKVSKKVIEGIFRINNFLYQLEDVFGDKLKNEELEEATNSLMDALSTIFAPEGLDSNVEDLIWKARVTDQSLKIATDNFLDGAGLI